MNPTALSVPQQRAWGRGCGRHRLKNMCAKNTEDQPVRQRTSRDPRDVPAPPSRHRQPPCPRQGLLLQVWPCSRLLSVPLCVVRGSSLKFLKGQSGPQMGDQRQNRGLVRSPPSGRRPYGLRAGRVVIGQVRLGSWRSDHWCKVPAGKIPAARSPGGRGTPRPRAA